MAHGSSTRGRLTHPVVEAGDDEAHDADPQVRDADHQGAELGGMSMFDGHRMITLVFQATPAQRFRALAPVFDQIAGSFRQRSASSDDTE